MVELVTSLEKSIGSKNERIFKEMMSGKKMTVPAGYVCFNLIKTS